MRNLSTETYDAVVEALMPHMTSEDERRTELLPVLSRMRYARTDWSGSSHSFTVRLVNRLSRADLIAILRRLRVGDEQHEELEELCKRLQRERRQVGARLRRSGAWTHFAAFVVGVVVAAPITWWFGHDERIRSSVDCPPPFEGSVADADADADESMEMNTDTATKLDAGTRADAQPVPEEPTPAQPPVASRSGSRAAKSGAREPEAEPQPRDCKAVARELAQVLTNDAPRADQCDEDGIMTVRVGADGLVTTSGPLRGYPIADGKSCGKISVKCPAHW